MVIAYIMRESESGFSHAVQYGCSKVKQKMRAHPTRGHGVQGMGHSFLNLISSKLR